MKTYRLLPMLFVSLLAPLFVCFTLAAELTDQDREMATAAAELYGKADFDGVWKLVSRFKQAQPKWTGGTCVLFENWAYSIPKGQDHATLLFLNRVIEHFPDDNAVAFAWALKGALYSEQGREEEMWDAYSRVVKLPPIKEPWKVGIGEPTPYNTAFEEIGQRHMKKRQFKEALACWENWPAWHWCGNCGGSLRGYRHEQIMLCRLQLGEHRKTARFIQETLEQDPNPDASGVLCAAYLGYVFYHRAGQDGDVLQLAREIQKRKAKEYDDEDHPSFHRRKLDFPSKEDFIASLPATVVVECDGFLRLPPEKQWAEFAEQRDSHSTMISAGVWDQLFQGEIIAEHGEGVIPSLEARIIAHPATSAWLIYSLARIPSEKCKILSCELRLARTLTRAPSRI